MADEVDRALERDEVLGPYMLRNARKPEAPPFSGLCLNCDEPTEFPHRWCDIDCRADWEQRQ